MNLGTKIGMVVSLLVLSQAALANTYYPPERIHCKLNETNQLSCGDFNRQYLAEDTYTVDFQNGKEQILYFVSGAAYFTDHQESASIFYSYHDARGKMVKLKTINSSLRPDFVNGSWKFLKDNIYVCDNSYMSCPITNTAVKSK